MAGALAKTFGALFLIGGVLALVAGAAAVGFGYVEAQEAQRGGLFGADRSQAQEAEAAMVLGAITGGVGLLFLVLGIILVIVGGSQARKTATLVPPPGASPYTVTYISK